MARQLAVCRSFLILGSPQLHPILLHFFAIIETPAASVVDVALVFLSVHGAKIRQSSADKNDAP